jgi:hypothetical protein
MSAKQFGLLLIYYRVPSELFAPKEIILPGGLPQELFITMYQPTVCTEQTRLLNRLG